MSHNGNNLRIEQTKGFITGLLIGGAVGAGTALLKAPNSGKKTRRMIHKQVAEVQNRAGQTVEGVRDRVQSASQQVMEQGKAVRERLQDAGVDGLDRVEEITVQATDSVEETVKGAVDEGKKKLS